MQTPLPGDEHEEVIAHGIRSAVRRGMDTPYRDAIIAGIEESDDNHIEIADGEAHADTSSKSTRTKLIQGISMFLVLFGTLYVALRRLGN